MKWNAWGDPAAAKPLSEGIKRLLEQALGVGGEDTAGPGIGDVRLRTSTLTAVDREALTGIVGAAYCLLDDHSRLLHAGGKSTLDLLRRRDTGEQTHRMRCCCRATKKKWHRFFFTARSTGSRWCRSAGAPAWWAVWIRFAVNSTRWCHWT